MGNSDELIVMNYQWFILVAVIPVQYALNFSIPSMAEIAVCLQSQWYKI
jgi:hypothetical protein